MIIIIILPFNLLLSCHLCAFDVPNDDVGPLTRSIVTKLKFNWSQHKSISSLFEHKLSNFLYHKLIILYIFSIYRERERHTHSRNFILSLTLSLSLSVNRMFHVKGALKREQKIIRKLPLFLSRPSSLYPAYILSLFSQSLGFTSGALLLVSLFLSLAKHALEERKSCQYFFYKFVVNFFARFFPV